MRAYVNTHVNKYTHKKRVSLSTSQWNKKPSVKKNTAVQQVVVNVHLRTSQIDPLKTVKYVQGLIRLIYFAHLQLNAGAVA